MQPQQKQITMKNKTFFIALLAMLTVWISSSAQNPDSLRRYYTQAIGITEATGHNDGQEVERFLAHVGLSAGAPWCAAFVSYCFYRAGYRTPPRSGWSPAFFPASRIVYNNSYSIDSYAPQVGDVFSIYYSSKKRIAHVGFVDARHKNYLITIEGNTNNTGSREGIGVFRKYRPIKSVHSVARYTE